jgi:hypothetical protein
MQFNDLLQKQKIDPQDVLIFRHCPTEPSLRKVLPWLAAVKPDLYNAFQQSQSPRVEKAMKEADYIASFICINAKSAVFAGLFAVKGWKEVDAEEWRAIPANAELLRAHGMEDREDGDSCLWFDLVLNSKFYNTWRGRLEIRWSGAELSWWRWASQNIFEVETIHELSRFEQEMPSWRTHGKNDCTHGRLGSTRTRPVIDLRQRRAGRPRYSSMSRRVQRRRARAIWEARSADGGAVGGEEPFAGGGDFGGGEGRVVVSRNGLLHAD